MFKSFKFNLNLTQPESSEGFILFFESYTCFRLPDEICVYI